MSRRSLRIVPFVLAAGSALFLLFLGGWAAFGPAGVRPGMARAEIEAKYGPADGNILEIGGRPVTAPTLVWKDRGLVVELDGEDRVRTVQRPPSVFDNLRSTLGL